MTDPTETELAARYLLDAHKQGKPLRTVELAYASEALTIDVSGRLDASGVLHVDPDNQAALDNWVRIMAELRQAGVEIDPVEVAPPLPPELVEIRSGEYIGRVARNGSADE